MLAWIPENLLNEKGSTEWDKFVKIEEHAVLDDEDDGTFEPPLKSLPVSILTEKIDAVLIELPTQRPESYAFSVPLTSVYSFIVHPPTLSSWCKFLHEIPSFKILMFSDKMVLLQLT